MCREQIVRVISAYDDLVIRAYCRGRFLILRGRFLDEIGQYLPEEGTILDVGCGFGLFSLYYAQLLPETHRL
jgi:2-polyprenyl-3-methyl-5-hydroxy-6-metoxy-1,4-benzoquinol methylase